MYNTQAFYFQKNLQGDIIGICDASGETVAQYTYDAWGECTITSDTSGCNIATINPYRYRSYYYDNEIGMYYLQSRYYDPEVGRFINADDRVGVNCGILSYTLYTYCGNAPVHLIDPSGYAWWVIAICVVVAVAAVAHVVNAAQAISQAEYNKSHDERELVHNQNDVDMKFGCKSFASVGCGAAATHNAIILAGGSSSLAEVVEFMQAHDLTLGFAGVYFTNIQLYLKRKGYSNKVYLTNLQNNIDKKIKTCSRKIAILAYKHPQAGHYVAIKYNKKSKKFEVYNTDMHISSVDQWIKGNAYTPLCLITM